MKAQSWLVAVGCIKGLLPSLTVNVVDKERLTAQSMSRKTKVRPLDRRSRYYLLTELPRRQQSVDHTIHSNSFARSLSTSAHFFTCVTVSRAIYFSVLFPPASHQVFVSAAEVSDRSSVKTLARTLRRSLRLIALSEGKSQPFVCAHSWLLR